MQRVILYASHVLVFIILTSCAVSKRVQYEDSDGYLPESFFNTIRPHKTLKQTVVRQLGAPVDRVRTLSGEDVYTYAFTHADYRHRSIFFILRNNSVKRDERYFHIAFLDDKVSRKWWNKVLEVDLPDIVERSPRNRPGADYAIRVIKNAKPDKTNFVLTKKVRVTGDDKMVSPESMKEKGMELTNKELQGRNSLTKNQASGEKKGFFDSIFSFFK